MSRRKYRVFEDCLEPTYLQLLPDCLSITYEHKSIIYIHDWNNIIELKPNRLQKLNAPINRKDLKHNLLEVYIATTEDSSIRTKHSKPSRKVFRFESRNSIDEFLTEAIRIGCIDRVVEKKWFKTTIRYLPCVIRSNNNELELDANGSHLSDK